MPSIDFFGFLSTGRNPSNAAARQRGISVDPVQRVFLQRAQDALELANIERGRREQAAAFSDAAYAILRAGTLANADRALRGHANELVAKAAAHNLGDAVWSEGDGAELAAAYLASIAEGSILDQVSKYAAVLHPSSHRVLIASDAVGDVVTEGDPKPVRRVDLAIGDAEPKKACAIIVATKELLNDSPESRRLFERELSAAVNRASNASLLADLVNSNTILVPSTGDPLDDLRAGLRAAGPSAGYVVAAPAGDVADLATREANRGGMGVRGGTFVPGVEIVAVDGLSSLTIIPASRLALFDSGLIIRSADHASVDMRDTPDSPAQLVSLWQTNSSGLLIERHWHLAQATEIVMVTGESSP